VDAVVEIDDIDISDREAVDERRIDMARDKLTNQRIPRTRSWCKAHIGPVKVFNERVKCSRLSADCTL
jgi:hypothetical protein